MPLVIEIFEAARERMRAASGQMSGILCTEEDWMTLEEKEIVHSWRIGLAKMTNERKNITQPTDWWAAWKAAADAEGKSLSAWIGEQCNASLKAKTQKQLSDRAQRGRPTTPKD